MGKHIDEHNLLLDKLTQCEVNSDVVFRKWHNGDAEINDIVCSNRDDIREAKVMLVGHIRTTSGDDVKLLEFEEHKKKHEKYIRMFWPIAIGFIAFLLREGYQFLMT